MEEVNLDIVEETKITYISSLLSTNLKEHMISLLQDFKDCFSWNYNEMTGLDRGLMEHCPPIKPEFHHFQQPPRRMSKEVELKVKEKIKKLLKANSHQAYKVCSMVSKYCSCDEGKWETSSMCGFQRFKHCYS